MRLPGPTIAALTVFLTVACGGNATEAVSPTTSPSNFHGRATFMTAPAVVRAWVADALTGDCGVGRDVYPVDAQGCAAAFPAIAHKRYTAMNVVSSSRGGDTSSGMRYIVMGVRNDGQPDDKYALNVEPVDSVWYLSSVFQDLTVGGHA